MPTRAPLLASSRYLGRLEVVATRRRVLVGENVAFLVACEHQVGFQIAFVACPRARL